MLKKIALLGELLSAGTGVSAFASTGADAENIGVSTHIPTSELSLERGTGKPSNVWNVKSQGRYYYSGQSAYNSLYTNYLFTGDSWYTVSAKNLKASSDTALKFQAYKQITFSPDKKIGVEQTVTGQKTVNYTLNGLSSSDKIYLEFKSPSHFEGYIE